MFDEIAYNKEMIKYAERMNFHFGYPIKVRILADTEDSMWHAEVLSQSFKMYDDITVLRWSREKDVADIFVLVGYLKDSELYELIERAKNKNPNICVIIYANDDEFNFKINRKYNIEYKYSIKYEIEDFIEYIKQIYEDKIKKETV